MGIKEVLQGLTDPRTLILSYLKAQGWQAARLDYHSGSGTLFLTILARGKAHSTPLPLSVTFTVEELANLVGRGDLADLVCDHAHMVKPAAAEVTPNTSPP